MVLVKERAATKSECSFGGTRISLGTDLDTDNHMDPSEITLDRVFCNPAPELKTKNVTIAPGSTCSAGGTKLVLGYDLSKDGSIDEIKSETTICNGMTLKPV